jgi:DNA polymerase-3 subunit gamma/tau
MGIEAEEQALMWMARESTGSLRDAYTLLDQIASFSGDSITMEKIRDKLGVVGLDELSLVCRELASGDTRRVLEETDRILARGIAVEQFIIDLLEYFRTVLFVSHSISTETLIGVPSEVVPEEILEAFTPVQIEKAIEYLLELHRKLRYSLNQRFELEVIMSRLSRLSRLISNDEILERLEIMRAELGTQEGKEEGREEGREEIPHQVSSLQRDVIDHFRRRRPTLSSALEKAAQWTLRENELCLRYLEKDRFSAELVTKEKSLLIGRLEEVIGARVRLSLEFAAEKHDRGEQGESERSGKKPAGRPRGESLRDSRQESSAEAEPPRERTTGANPRVGESSPETRGVQRGGGQDQSGEEESREQTGEAAHEALGSLGPRAGSSEVTDEAKNLENQVEMVKKIFKGEIVQGE